MARPGKRAAVLCPGPSLASALPELRAGRLGDFDHVIAVNRAAAAWPADFWSIWDPESFGDVQPLGRPAIIMARQHWQTLLAERPEAGRHHSVMRDDLAHPPRNTGWDSWSATVAVVAAWNLGATDIRVLGCDLEGTADWDGARLDRHKREPERWAREADAWTLLINWLRIEGVDVIRERITGGTAVRQRLTGDRA